VIKNHPLASEKLVRFDSLAFWFLSLDK
jgi:hypothetical protein